MIARLVMWAAAAASFFFAGQSFGFTADGDTEFGAVLLSLSLLLTGVCCVAGGLIRPDLTHNRIQALQRQLAAKDEELGEWKRLALGRVDEIAVLRAERNRRREVAS